MPLINVKLIDGVFSEPQKSQIATKLTDAMVSIEGENMRPVTWVVIEEVKSGDWAIGGKVLTTADVKALAATPLQSSPSSTKGTAAGVARLGT
jgi:4-oxalocrotonate tautomerase